MSLFGESKQEFEASARVVDGKLILSFPNATSPIVWQMDLNDVKASALEVIEVEEGFALNLKTPKGENVQVAPFANKNDAVEGLMAASEALENAHGAINPGSTSSAPAVSQQKKGMNRWVAVALGILLIFVLLNILAVIAGPPQNFQAGTTIGNNTVVDPNAAGVPLSADDFLNAQ